MLYLKYPEAFEQGRNAKKLKKEYRGIFDVLNGASGGHIRLGYRHKDEYWKIKKNLEREAWDQCGRMLYKNDESIALMKELFPDTTAEVERILKEMIK